MSEEILDAFILAVFCYENGQTFPLQPMYNIPLGISITVYNSIYGKNKTTFTLQV